VPPEPPEPVRGRVRLSSTGAGAKGEQLAVTLSRGATTIWECKREGALGAGRLDEWCPLPKGWAESKGTYRFDVAYTPKAGRSAEQATQAWPMSGDELDVDVRIELGGSGQRSLQRLVVTRVRSAPAQVQLVRKFAKPWHPQLALRYELVNGDAKMDLRGEAVKGYFIGRLERRSEGDWVPYGRGVTCDAVHGTSQLTAGATGPAIEGHYVGDLRPLDPGLYRFRVRLRADDGANDAKAALVDAYELRDEIEVTARSKRPTEPGADCDSPFAIDRWGLKRFKPECL
jgi:hypothetical protein